MADDTTQWCGTAMAHSMPLPVEQLRFPWRRYARAGITLAELLSRDSLRPDLMRGRRVYGAGRVYEAGLVLARLKGDGRGVPYQIPDAIPCHMTFAYNIGKVLYVDRMAERLVGRLPGAPRRFILSEVEELYVSPLPYAYSKTLVALQKSASSLMRLYGIVVWPHDWATYRHREEDDGRVFSSASFEQVITPRDFPELQEVVRESLPLFGVHALLPYALKHFDFACSDLDHPAHADLVHNVEREWAWALGNAFMAEVHINRSVFVQPIEVLAFLGRVAFDLPIVPLHPLEANSKHSMWSFASVLSIMHRACQVPDRTQRPWTDYTTGERSAFLLYDMQIDPFAAKPASPPPSPITAGRRAGVGSVRREAQRKRHREGDSDVPASATSRITNFQSPETSGVPPKFASGVPAVPPLNLVGQDPLPHSATPQLILSPGDVLENPGLARALGNSSRRVWKVGGLLSTLANWHLTRSDEAHRINP